MARRTKSNVRTFKAEGGADFGPGLRLRQDGRLADWGGAAVVDVVTRDDPAVTDRRRLVRGARRRDALFDLEQRRVITTRMRHAAEQFLDDCSIASGSTAAAMDDAGFPTLLGPRVGLPERQVSAISRINQARNCLGLNSGTVFWWVIFENRSLGDYEATHRLRNGSATSLLREALDALDQHYFRTTARNAY